MVSSLSANSAGFGGRDYKPEWSGGSPGGPVEDGLCGIQSEDGGCPTQTQRAGGQVAGVAEASRELRESLGSVM